MMEPVRIELTEEEEQQYRELLRPSDGQRRKEVGMNEAHKKAQATRERNQEAQRRRYAEQAESIRVARLALQRVMESEDTSPAQILEAARLLVEIGK